MQTSGVGLPVFGEEKRQGLWAWKGCQCSVTELFFKARAERSHIANCQPLLANLLVSKSMLW